MTKPALFYERAAPVSAQRHRDWSLEPRADYAFAGHTNSVPLAAVEFPFAAVEYAIVCTGTEAAVQPAVVLGLKPDENLYLDPHGKWDARYVPAFVRRYPFVFSTTREEGKLVLCIDEECAGWNQEGRGERLFDVSGERTGYFNKTFKFLQEYQRESHRTQAFCRKLQDLGLLEPMTARFKLPSGQQAALTGFMAVDRDRLKALPAEKLAALAKTNELELIYIHLQSMRNLAGMVARATGKKAETDATLEGAGLPADEHLH